MLSLADTPYCMTCDQDDVWLPEKIALTLEKMREVSTNPIFPNAAASMASHQSCIIQFCASGIGTNRASSAWLTIIVQPVTMF